MILALLVSVATWFVLLGSDQAVLATDVRSVDVGVRDTRSTDEARIKVTRPRTVDPREAMKSGQVDPVEVIGLMMMLGSPRGR